ncbi:Mediator-associated protein 1 [Acorus gramineus]|uniref:Mediator-associated protein 1 n=1 Tax=Acorus gramineus TaxID=55184 RepID=A0AAV9B9P2_ACOGR|nr:Mediator-associated protein 1 [Acorus gramineus]
MTKRTSATSSASGSSTSATGSASSASEGEAEKTSSVATAAAPPTQPTEPSTPQDSQTADPSIKPISSKPMDPSSKPSSAIITIKPSSTANRRSSSSFDSRKKNKKKPRTSAASASELRRRLTASSSSGRFWSESDELAILRGLVRFIAEKSDGAVPASAMEVTPFLEFIRGTLGVNPTPTQLSDKIRRLRMKYNNAVPALDWSTPHDVTAANLAKKIWSGGGGGAGSPVKEEPKSSSRKRSKSSARTARKASKSFLDGFSSHARSIVLENGLGDASVEEELAVEDGGVDRYLFLNESLEVCRDVSKTGFTEGVLKKGLGLLRWSKARELEEKWRELWELENELSEKRVKLVKEQMREISYALKLAGRA